MGNKYGRGAKGRINFVVVQGKYPLAVAGSIAKAYQHPVHWVPLLMYIIVDPGGDGGGYSTAFQTVCLFIISYYPGPTTALPTAGIHRWKLSTQGCLKRADTRSSRCCWQPLVCSTAPRWWESTCYHLEFLLISLQPQRFNT